MKVNIILKGTLYVVATPIGNMEDITFRAIKVLSFVELVVAENMKITKRLLNHYNIKTRLLPMNEHNERVQIAKILRKINSGASVALVSDAGTPLVSDPGFRLVRETISSGIGIVPIPGVSAVISSLSVAGIPTDIFTFFGFPSKKKGKRLEQLSKIISEKKTFVFYESPRRIITFLKEIIEVLGDRYVVLSREMTKIHEEFIRGKASYIINELKNRDRVKGECTLLVSGSVDNSARIFNRDDVVSSIRNHLNDGFTTSDLSKLISYRYGLAKNEAYNIILDVRKNLNCRE